MYTRVTLKKKDIFASDSDPEEYVIRGGTTLFPECPYRVKIMYDRDFDTEMIEKSFATEGELDAYVSDFLQDKIIGGKYTTTEYKVEGMALDWLSGQNISDDV